MTTKTYPEALCSDLFAMIRRGIDAEESDADLSAACELHILDCPQCAQRMALHLLAPLGDTPHAAFSVVTAQYQLAKKREQDLPWFAPK
jgi:hypothetical protein